MEKRFFYTLLFYYDVESSTPSVSKLCVKHITLHYTIY